VLLFVSVLGLWLGLALLALYFLLLTAGLLTGTLALADLGLLLAHRAEAPTRRWRLGTIGAACAAMWLLSFVPGLGALVVFATLVFGTGALALGAWRRYRAAP
jgi:hypothetical protein